MTSSDSSAPDVDGSLVIRDAATLRAVAHPARMRILERLVMEGPMTATQCAGLTGLSPSACSYHLRLLGRAGLVAEAPSSEDHRRRPWKATFRNLSMAPEEPSLATPEFNAAARGVAQQVLAISERRTMEYLDTEAEEASDWRAAGGLTQDILDLTVDEAIALREDLEKLVAAHSLRRGSATPVRPLRPDSRLVHFEFRLIPLPGQGQEPTGRPAGADFD
ncbi:MAG TPA: winged helix-turn-helix domain-containing protein [Candidatus Nanopelagicaceae bacterium]|nr:winged helix-turn-helix domain-containing protein [Candidatus Nanopelagicaceae bacterium]